MKPGSIDVHSFQRLRPALGTLVAVEGVAPHEAAADIAIGSAYGAIERVETLMHPTRPGSDLQRLSVAAPGVAVAVDAWTFRLLRLSRELHHRSQGLFEPCTADLPGRMMDVELREPNVVACYERVALDLGGIAKGFAVDRAIDALLSCGCESGLVNAGGDLRAFGSEARTLIVRVTDRAIARIELTAGALAVSAPRSDKSPPEHRGYYLGTTRELVPGRCVAVNAAEASIADGLCKCAMLCPAPVTEALLRSYAARLIDIVEA